MTTEMADEKLKAAGWSLVETSGFLSLIGPLWERVVNGDHEYAILTEDKHHNRRNRVQGGLLMTLADRASGMIARLVSGRPTLATVQMDVHFHRRRQDRRASDRKAARGPRHPQPDLHKDRGGGRGALHRDRERRVQNPERQFLTFNRKERASWNIVNSAAAA